MPIANGPSLRGSRPHSGRGAEDDDGHRVTLGARTRSTMAMIRLLSAVVGGYGLTTSTHISDHSPSRSRSRSPTPIPTPVFPSPSPNPISTSAKRKCSHADASDPADSTTASRGNIVASRGGTSLHRGGRVHQSLNWLQALPLTCLPSPSRASPLPHAHPLECVRRRHVCALW